MARISGVLMRVLYNGVSIRADEFDPPVEMNLPDVTNCLSASARELVTGIYHGDWTVKGPYDEGGMNGIVVGATVTINLVVDVTTGVGFTATAMVKSYKVAQKVQDAARYELVLWTTGAFTFTAGV